MRVLIIGMGRQGQKRAKAARDAGDEVITVDPFVQADYKYFSDVPPDYDAAVICTPEDVKNSPIPYLLYKSKHILIEKPILAARDQLRTWERMAFDGKLAFHVGYNHRFEANIVKINEYFKLIEPIYHIRMFYGNGTCADIKDTWKDTGGGVIPEVGSHLFDLLRFWFPVDWRLDLALAARRENAAPEHAVVWGQAPGTSALLEMSWWSWRNTFTVDLYGERGSAHMNGLRKWFGSELKIFKRTLPSGVPERVAHVFDNFFDRTWELEWDYFKQQCARPFNDFDHQIRLARWINDLSAEAIEQCCR